MRGAFGKECVLRALRAGLRHIDTALVYRNEYAVGAAIREALSTGIIESRSELFVTSKLWIDHCRPDLVELGCRRSLEKLGLSYLDLYLVHWAVAWKFQQPLVRDRGVSLQDTWAAMERLVDKGLVRSIGVSNYEEQDLVAVLKSARIRPCVNQIELHPLWSRVDLVEFCKKENIVCVAWAPLGRMRKQVVQNRIIDLIASQQQCTPCQVILRWAIQRGVAVIPRSKSADHIKENIAAASLKLNDRDMWAIDQLDRDCTLFPLHEFIGLGGKDTPVWKSAIAMVLGLLARIVFAVPFFRLDMGRESTAGL